MGACPFPPRPSTPSGAEPPPIPHKWARGAAWRWVVGGAPRILSVLSRPPACQCQVAGGCCMVPVCGGRGAYCRRWVMCEGDTQPTHTHHTHLACETRMGGGGARGPPTRGERLSSMCVPLQCKLTTGAHGRPPLVVFFYPCPHLGSYWGGCIWGESGSCRPCWWGWLKLGRTPVLHLPREPIPRT